MKGFLLDTNVVSELRKGSRANRTALRWFDRRVEESLYLSVMTVGELHNGLERLVDGRRRAELFDFVSSVEERFAARTLCVEPPIARRWGTMSAQASAAGRALEVVDGLIAATAFEADLTVATRNERHFVGLGIRVVNPFEP